MVFDLFMIDIVIVEVLNPGYFYGVCGVGEIGIVLFLVVVVNVVFNVVGVWLKELFMFLFWILKVLKD